MNLKEISVYPVKSMGAATVESADIDRRGPAGDRRWMVVDQHARFLTGRTLPALVRFTAIATASGLTVRFEDDELFVPKPTAQAAAVTVWRDTISARDCGDAAAQWLSQRLQREVRLVFQSDDDYRWLPDGKRVFPNDEVSFADGYPLMLIGSASLEALNESLDPPVSMRSFRPNLVIETTEPFCEDTWEEVSIGSVRFSIPSQCTRCVFTTIDPATGTAREDGEPLATLLRSRRRESDGKPVFGVNLIPHSGGTVSVGDAVSPG